MSKKMVNKFVEKDYMKSVTCVPLNLVARMIKFWNAPLLTTGACTNDFSFDKRDPKSKYFLLVRTGTLDFQDIADVVLNVLNRYSWKNVLLIYEIDGYWEVSGKQSCSLMTKTLVEMFKGNASIRYNAFDLAKNPQNNLTENLRNEIPILEMLLLRNFITLSQRVCENLLERIKYFHLTCDCLNAF
ncbi:hypothetical protein QTP88_016563 [Uroleucon formosanum]